MSRVTHGAIVGVIALLGAVGCTAQAGTSPEESPTPTVSATPSASASVADREPIKVTLDPNRVIEGERSSVWVLANCPVPTGGPELSGRASSRAFLRSIRLDPLPPPRTASPAATASPSPIPWVRGEATVPSTVDAGTYTVTVECLGTNDRGRARLRVVTEPSVVPTRAPRAGGGGTAAGGPEEGTGLGAGSGLVIALLVAGAIGLVVRRRRS